MAPPLGLLSAAREGVGRLHLNDTLRTEFDRLFASIEQTHNSGRRFAEELAMNLLERLLSAVEEDPRSNRCAIRALSKPASTSPTIWPAR